VTGLLEDLLRKLTNKNSIEKNIFRKIKEKYKEF